MAFIVEGKKPSCFISAHGSWSLAEGIRHVALKKGISSHGPRFDSKVQATRLGQVDIFTSPSLEMLWSAV